LRPTQSPFIIRRLSSLLFCFLAFPEKESSLLRVWKPGLLHVDGQIVVVFYIGHGAAISE
jgi:hypothetical protein